jgi:hypothetical protein
MGIGNLMGTHSARKKAQKYSTKMDFFLLKSPYLDNKFPAAHQNIFSIFSDL